MAKLRIAIPLLVAFALFLTVAATYGVVSSQSANGKYDADGDGLIEIEYLEQLNAIRYDLDGDGLADGASGRDAYDAAFLVSGSERVCPHGYCSGYELTRPLDFRDRTSYASGRVNAKWTEGTGWLPIGFGESPFEATLDGNEHTIANLYINRTTDRDDPGSAGLFGVANSSSIVMRTGLSNVNVSGEEYVGGLVGGNDGEIISSHVTGNVSGESSVGGLVGYNSGTITGSYATGSVSAEEGYGYVGGLVGSNYGGTITGSYATGNVSGEYYEVGGLVGKNRGNDSTITGSYATGNVSGNGQVGGLVGSNYGGTVTGSTATGSVSGEGYIGGLVGDNSGTVSGSYATGVVSLFPKMAEMCDKGLKCATNLDAP